MAEPAHRLRVRKANDGDKVAVLIECAARDLYAAAWLLKPTDHSRPYDHFTGRITGLLNGWNVAPDGRQHPVRHRSAPDGRQMHDASVQVSVGAVTMCHARQNAGSPRQGWMWQALSMASSGSIQGVSFQVHDGSATAEIIDQLIRIWAEEHPAEDADYRQRLALRHTACDGFRCFTATCDGEIVGYAYGMYNGQGTGLNGPGKVSSVGSHDLLDEWTAKGAPDNPWISPDWRPAFDVADVQVLVAYRHRGIGKRLVLEICRSVPGDEPVVLTVAPDNTDARGVYRRVGFRDLLAFPIMSMYLPMNPQMLMGLRHARDAGAAAGDE